MQERSSRMRNCGLGLSISVADGGPLTDSDDPRIVVSAYKSALPSEDIISGNHERKPQARSREWQICDETDE